MRTWVKNHCKFAQPTQPTQPAQPMKDEDIYWQSLNNLKIVSKKGDSEIERQYHDDPHAFEPGTIKGGLSESYWHEIRLQGKIYWNQTAQETFSDEPLEEVLKESIYENTPSDLKGFLVGEYKIEFNSIVAMSTEDPNWKMVTMDLTIEGESDVDEPEPDYDAWEDRQGY